MSSLIFYTDESQICLATDTLATTGDGRPLRFTSKALYLPHLRMIVACTGVGGLLDMWVSAINYNSVVHGIQELNRSAPYAIREVFAELGKRVAIPPGLTATVYHFGLSEIDDKVRTYAYRSTENFECDPRPYGLAVKPPEGTTVASPWDIPNDFVRLMEEQRIYQGSRPAPERVHIGGEIEMMYLSAESFIARRLHRFADYESVDLEIGRRFTEMRGRERPAEVVEPNM